jgi:hypothetical protein
MNCYKTVNFKFSDQSWAWLQSFTEPIVADYQKNAVALSALVRFNDSQLETFLSSKPWIELTQFMSSYNLSDLYPQLFIYKQLPQQRKIVLGNPHIDTTGVVTSTETTIPVRFNILLNGDENTEMFWWNIDRNSPVIANEKFTNPMGKTVGRLQAPGKSLEEKWGNLDEPIARSNSLAKKQEYASFVRTDILHALNWTGANPRLILSVRSTTAWPF